jgi:hypothetical protein
MMAMTAAINKDSFRGQRQVTCYSCHRGSLRPVAVPPVEESDTPTRPAPSAPPAAGTPVPTVDDIIAKYLTAVGGADAMKKITSRTMTGTVMAMGSETAIDLYTKAPNKRVSISHTSPTSESFTAFDGTAGWLGTTGHAAREMSPTEAFASSLDADFYLVAHLKDLFPQLRRGRPAEVAGAMCETIGGSKPGQPPVVFYFDQKTGLLQRMVRSADTPMALDSGAPEWALHDPAQGSEEQCGHRRCEIRQARRGSEVGWSFRRPSRVCGASHGATDYRPFPTAGRAR